MADAFSWRGQMSEIMDEGAVAPWLYEADIRIITAIGEADWPLILRAVKLKKIDKTPVAQCLFYPPEAGYKAYYLSIPVCTPVSDATIRAAIDSALESIRKAVSIGAPLQIDSPAASDYHARPSA
jgi:hypothetical protein